MISNDKNKCPTAEILSHSPVIARLLEEVEQVAETDIAVLVLGETGVGKSLLARTIHALSPRRDQAFISVNCGALPTGLIESELFGHEKGAFTNAGKRRLGCFERAHGGTLFLDEIGAWPLESQQVLLHILEENRLTRVGGEASIPVDVRVVAATNRNLHRAVQEEAFRADLYYRLRVFPVVLPPLRERREDIPLLAAHFVCQYADPQQRVPTLSDEALAYLQAHSWPGNVRELEHRMQRAVIVCEDGVIEGADVLSAEEEDKAGALEPLAGASAVPSAAVEVSGDWGARQTEVAKADKEQIEAALQATEGRIYGEHGAARLLGMGPEKLRYYMRKYGVQRPKKSS